MFVGHPRHICSPRLGTMPCYKTLIVEVLYVQLTWKLKSRLAGSFSPIVPLASVL